MNSLVSFARRAWLRYNTSAHKLRVLCVLKVHVDVLYSRTHDISPNVLSFLSRNDSPADAHLKMVGFVA